jgi:AGZA family xanthine/uracil permease-like MFS transporter
MAAWIDKLNDAVAQSFVGRHFQLEGSGHRRERKNTKFTTELRAGLTIFFAMVILMLEKK